MLGFPKQSAELDPWLLHETMKDRVHFFCHREFVLDYLMERFFRKIFQDLGEGGNKIEQGRFKERAVPAVYLGLHAQTRENTSTVLLKSPQFFCRFLE